MSYRPKIPPYFGNPKNTSCNQAVTKMILKHFFPNEDKSWEELDTICHTKPEKWTHDLAAPLYFAKRGLKTHIFEDGNLEEMHQSYEGHIVKAMGQEYLELFQKNCDMDDHKSTIADLYTLFKNNKSNALEWTPSYASIKQAKELLDQDHLLLTWIDANVLLNNKEKNGHFILIYDYIDSANRFVFHNPGTVNKYGPIWQCFGQTEPFDRMLEASGQGKGISCTAVKP